MTYTITQFANDTTPALSDLDQNFNAAFVLTPIPCSVAGTNALTLTQNAAGQAASGVIAAYANGLAICGIAAQTNSGAATAALGALPALNIYKDSISGPIVLAGNEIVAACSFTLKYDSALNSNAGGWHLIANITTSGNTITPALVRPSVGVVFGGATLTGIGRTTSSVTFTAILPNATQDQTVAVVGVAVSQAIVLSLPPPVSAGLQFQYYISSGTVTVRASNNTSNVTITPGIVPLQLSIMAITP